MADSVVLNTELNDEVILALDDWAIPKLKEILTRTVCNLEVLEKIAIEEGETAIAEETKIKLRYGKANLHKIEKFLSKNKYN